MKLTILPLLALLAMPAAAQERWQVGLGANFKGSNDFVMAAPGGKVRNDAKAAPALQVGYRVYDAGAWDLTATAEYQFPTVYKVTSNAADGVSPNGTYKASFLAPGLQWNHHAHRSFDWGVGLQLRFVDLRSNYLGGTISTSNNKPWLDLHARYSFDAGSTRPYVGLRVARALASAPRQPSAQDFGVNPDQALRDTMRRLEGQFEVGLQAGFRF